VLDFSVGASQPTPLHIRRRRRRPSPRPDALHGRGGEAALRAAVAQRYRKDFKVAFSDAEVAITTGKRAST
jgi:aspartate/methionine/tyrosine aminotransferase